MVTPIATFEILNQAVQTVDTTVRATTTHWLILHIFVSSEPNGHNIKDTWFIPFCRTVLLNSVEFIIFL
jgi:hypothetical protein